jgi:hypothetical protein
MTKAAGDDKPAEEPAEEPAQDSADQPVTKAATDEIKKVAIVKKHGDWTLVTYGSWQISVGPDGLPHLPRHLHPREWADFAGAMAVAVDVGNDIMTSNEEKGKADTINRPSRRAVVTQGPPPEGTTRMRATSKQQKSASIGRPKRRINPTATRTPTADQRPSRRTTNEGTDQ